MGFEQFDLSRFEREPALGILRGIKPEQLDRIFETIIASGLKHVEITLNTPDALRLIEKAVAKYSESVCVGAGTVLSAEDAKNACHSGSRFIVAPTLNQEVASFCSLEDIPYFPGALTPTEIERCWQAGATMVKVFPASRFGPDYFKEIKGPFNEIKLMAVGGVRPENIKDYLNAGASALALGGSIFSTERLELGEFSKIHHDLKVFLSAINKYFHEKN